MPSTGGSGSGEGEGASGPGGNGGSNGSRGDGPSMSDVGGLGIGTGYGSSLGASGFGGEGPEGGDGGAAIAELSRQHAAEAEREDARAFTRELTRKRATSNNERYSAAKAEAKEFNDSWTGAFTDFFFGYSKEASVENLGTTTGSFDINPLGALIGLTTGSFLGGKIIGAIGEKMGVPTVNISTANRGYTVDVVGEDGETVASTQLGIGGLPELTGESVAQSQASGFTESEAAGDVAQVQPIAPTPVTRAEEVAAITPPDEAVPVDAGPPDSLFIRYNAPTINFGQLHEDFQIELDSRRQASGLFDKLEGIT